MKGRISSMDRFSSLKITILILGINTLNSSLPHWASFISCPFLFWAASHKVWKLSRLVWSSDPPGPIYQWGFRQVHCTQVFWNFVLMKKYHKLNTAAFEKYTFDSTHIFKIYQASCVSYEVCLLKCTHALFFFLTPNIYT